MSREKQIEDQSEVLYGGRREGGKRFAEMCAKVFENAEAHPENYDDMFAGYENDLNKAVALIEWQKQEIESLTIRMNAFGLAVKSLAKERSKRFLLKENGEIVPLTKQAEWISVEERLPEEYKECLVAAKVGDKMVIDIAERVRSFDMRTNSVYLEWLITNDWNEGQGCEITHWMPLPEAPKMKGGGE